MGAALQRSEDLALGELRVALKEHGNRTGDERRRKGSAGRYAVQRIDLLALRIRRTPGARRAVRGGENARCARRNRLL